MIELKKLSAGQFLYKKDENGITKAVVISSGPDSAMLVLVAYVDEVENVHQYEVPQKYLLTHDESSLWSTSIDGPFVNKKEEYEWLLGIGGTDEDDVFMRKFKATLKDAIKKLMTIINADKKENKDIFEYGTKSAKELTKDEQGYYGYNVFCDRHIDYRLTRMDSIGELQ